MDNIYSKITELAKSTRAQNLFVAAKELSHIKLFRNDFDLTKLQEIYLSYLYVFDSINKDIVIENISKHVLDNEIFWDAYLLWKRKNKSKNEQKDKTGKDIRLVMGNKIKFPNEVK